MGTSTQYPAQSRNNFSVTFQFFQFFQFFRAIPIMFVSAAFFATLMVLANGASTKRVASEPIKKIATMGGSTFWLINKSLTAGNAAAECAKQGGKLASLNTQKKIDFVTSKILLNQETAWIGAKCNGCTLVKEEKWFWPNGEQLVVGKDSTQVRNKMWKVYYGKQTAWDASNPEDAINTGIYYDSGLGWMFVNWNSAGSTDHSLCEIEN